jgi:hypothetical protein
MQGYLAFILAFAFEPARFANLLTIFRVKGLSKSAFDDWDRVQPTMN